MTIKHFALQNYNKFLEYANIWAKKMRIFMQSQEKRYDEMTGWRYDEGDSNAGLTPRAQNKDTG